MCNKSLFLLLLSFLFFSAACKPRESVDVPNSKQQPVVARDDFASILKEDAIQYKRAQNGAPVETAGSLNLAIDSQADILASSSVKAINDSLDKNKDGQVLNVAGGYFVDEFEKAIIEAKMQKILDENTLSLANDSDQDAFIATGSIFLFAAGLAFTGAIVEFIAPGQLTRRFGGIEKNPGDASKPLSTMLKEAEQRTSGTMTTASRVFIEKLAHNLPDVANPSREQIEANRKQFTGQMNEVSNQISNIMRGNVDPGDVRKVKDYISSLKLPADTNNAFFNEIDLVVEQKTDWIRLKDGPRAELIGQLERDNRPLVEEYVKGSVKGSVNKRKIEVRNSRERGGLLGVAGILFTTIGSVFVAGAANLAGSEPYVECASISSESERLQCWNINRVRHTLKMGELYKQYDASF